MNEDTYTYLHSLGLIPSEAKLYVALLQQSQPQSILEISQLTGMARTTVHENMASLIEKGLVSETRVNGKRKVTAEEPFVLQTFLDEQQIEIKKRFLQLKHLKDLLPKYVEKLSTPTLSYS